MKRDHPPRQPHPGDARPRRSPGRSDAPGDPPLQAESLSVNTPFTLDAATAGRLRRREINPKEAFTIRDSSGAFFRASLREMGPSGGTALAYERMTCSPEPGIEIILACAVLARQRMIFVMQKATELGVSAVVPLLTDYSVQPAGLEHEKAHAWPGQVIRAARQCRRGSLPAVLPPTALAAFLDSPAVSAADLRLFMDDRVEAAPSGAGSPQRLILFVGPEGGFTDTERAALRAKGVLPLALGGRVLRAETAVIAGLTAVQLRWGDFRSP